MSNTIILEKQLKRARAGMQIALNKSPSNMDEFCYWERIANLLQEWVDDIRFKEGRESIDREYSIEDGAFERI